jgi:hypothetical protein
MLAEVSIANVEMREMTQPYLSEMRYATINDSRGKIKMTQENVSKEVFIRLCQVFGKN